MQKYGTSTFAAIDCNHPQRLVSSEPAGIFDMFLRKEETNAMIISDEKLDRGAAAIAPTNVIARVTRADLQPERVSEGGRQIFIWIRCNPLKRPDSAKEKQGNASFFVWFYLVFLAFI
jgi:hypothetical protein